MKPTVGRVVYFYPAATRSAFGFLAVAGQPLAAIICHVNSPTSVNVSVFDVHGKQFPVSGVPFFETEQPGVAGEHCAWMPYQRERASKQDAAARNDMHAEAMASI
jgi:hypothetical protein